MSIFVKDDSKAFNLPLTVNGNGSIFGDTEVLLKNIERSTTSVCTLDATVLYSMDG